jgi:hypothetical protein
MRHRSWKEMAATKGKTDDVNPKSEARNSKQIQITEIQNSEHFVLIPFCFGHSVI